MDTRRPRDGMPEPPGDTVVSSEGAKKGEQRAKMVGKECTLTVIRSALYVSSDKQIGAALMSSMGGKRTLWLSSRFARWCVHESLADDLPRGRPAGMA